MSAQPLTVETQVKHRASKPVIRMATDSEGKAIHKLVTDSGFTVTGIDWSKVAPYWLVAEMGGEIVGCVQVCLSIPIGRIEMLSIVQNASHMLRAILVKQLVTTAASTLKAAGAQMAAGMIPFDMKSYKKVLKRYGCVSIGVGNNMAQRLT